MAGPPEPRIAVVIPAYNEARNIGDIVIRTRSHRFTVIVVDDGSEDQTSDLARAAGGTVIRLEKNYGLGHASKTGLALALRLGFDIIVTMDADGQHVPEEIEDLVRPVARGEEAAFGYRAGNLDSMPVWRKILNRGTRVIVRIVAGRSVRDPLCGFRAFSRRCLRRLELRGKGHELVPGVAINALLLGMKIPEIPISCIYDPKPFHYRIPDLFTAIRLYAYFSVGRILRRYRSERRLPKASVSRMTSWIQPLDTLGNQKISCSPPD